MTEFILNGLGLGGVADEMLMSEVTALILAGKQELRTAGVRVTDTDDLTRVAILYYCKANWGFDNPDKLFFEKRFDRLKAILSLDAETRCEYAVDGTPETGQG